MPYIVAGSVSPISSATGDFVSYVVSFGVLGIAAVLFTLRIIVPRSAVDEAKAQARTDLLKENERLIAAVARAEAKADAALGLAQEKLIPLLTSFVATSSALIPLLQEIVRDREGRH